MAKEKEKTIVRLWEAIVTGIVLDLFLLIFIWMALAYVETIIPLVTFYLFIGHWAVNTVILIFPKSRNSKYGRNFIRFALFVPFGFLFSALFFCAIGRALLF